MRTARPRNVASQVTFTFHNAAPHRPPRCSSFFNAWPANTRCGQRCRLDRHFADLPVDFVAGLAAGFFLNLPAILPAIFLIGAAMRPSTGLFPDAAPPDATRVWSDAGSAAPAAALPGSPATGARACSLPAVSPVPATLAGPGPADGRAADAPGTADVGATEGADSPRTVHSPPAVIAPTSATPPTTSPRDRRPALRPAA